VPARHGRRRRQRSQHAGYALHFCSEECKHRFDADPDKVIAKLPDKPLA